jgi:hypothetical protein
MEDQIYRAVELDVPEIWTFGIHAWDKGKFPYNINFTKRQQLVIDLNDYVDYLT